MVLQKIGHSSLLHEYQIVKLEGDTIIFSLVIIRRMDESAEGYTGP